jgi:hypothetical protein
MVGTFEAAAVGLLTGRVTDEVWAGVADDIHAERIIAIAASMLNSDTGFNINLGVYRFFML